MIRCATCSRELGTGDFGMWQCAACRESADDRLALVAAASKQGDEIERLRTEVKVLRKDAERYLWLRDHCLGMDAVADPDNLVSVWHGTHPAHKTQGRTLDAAVDAAMEKKKLG